MNSIYEQMDLLKSIMDMLEQQFGSRCEIVLHDMTRDYNHTIVDIRNGHVTGRKIGGSGSNLGLEVLSGNDKDGNRYNYVNHTREGKIFRSSSIYFRDDTSRVIGSLCINLDITDTVKFEQYLKEYNQYDIASQAQTSPEGSKEIFVDDVSQILEYLCNEGVQLIGKQPSEMNRENKMQFLEFLDKKGAFLISKSNERICEFLQISKFTLYNYLDVIRSNGGERNGK